MPFPSKTIDKVNTKKLYSEDVKRSLTFTSLLLFPQAKETDLLNEEGNPRSEVCIKVAKLKNRYHRPCSVLFKFENRKGV